MQKLNIKKKFFFNLYANNYLGLILIWIDQILCLLLYLSLHFTNL